MAKQKPRQQSRKHNDINVYWKGEILAVCRDCPSFTQEGNELLAFIWLQMKENSVQGRQTLQQFFFLCLVLFIKLTSMFAHFNTVIYENVNEILHLTKDTNCIFT